MSRSVKNVCVYPKVISDVKVSLRCIYFSQGHFWSQGQSQNVYLTSKYKAITNLKVILIYVGLLPI